MKYLLHDGEPITNAWPRATEKSKLITPYTRNRIDGFGKIGPSFWPEER
jgi:hypothetical protein